MNDAHPASAMSEPPELPSGPAATAAPAAAEPPDGPDAPAATERPDTSIRPALPDHLSVDPRSPHHVVAVFAHDVRIRFNDKERFDVSEYCISEGWVRVPAGKSLDRRGQPLLIKLKGRVEAFYG